MKLPAYTAMLLLLGFVGCKESSSNEEGAKLQEGTERSGSIALPNWMPTPQNKKINPSEIGMNLDDAVKTLGPWDQVGDLMGDEGGRYYPFSGRNGYDYLVQISEHSSINAVWRKQQAISLNSEQGSTHHSTTHPESKSE